MPDIVYCNNHKRTQISTLFCFVFSKERTLLEINLIARIVINLILTLELTCLLNEQYGLLIWDSDDTRSIQVTMRTAAMCLMNSYICKIIHNSTYVKFMFLDLDLLFTKSSKNCYNVLKIRTIFYTMNYMPFCGMV